MNIKLNACTFGEEEIQAVNDVMRSGFVTMGAQVEAFENEFAKKMGAKHAVMVNSGSSANLLAWFALTNPQFFGTCDGEWSVIVPAVSWGTTYWPIVQAGGKLIVIDSDPHTLQMDCSQIEGAILDSTVAINPVHILGDSVNMEIIKDVSKTYGLAVIEDTCEALGAQWQGQYLGTIGDVGTYSFYFSHHITSIEGGMVVTNSDKRAEVLRMMRSHGWSRASENRSLYERSAPSLDPDFFFVTTGFNLRPTEINAAIGRIQFRKLDEFNARRRKIAAYWDDRFENNYFFYSTERKVQAAPFGYPVICSDQITRNDLKNHLNVNGIETRPIVSGKITRHPAMLGLNFEQYGALDGANIITDCGLMWGLHPMLTDAEVEYVAKVVEAFRT